MDFQKGYINSQLQKNGINSYKNVKLTDSQITEIVEQIKEVSKKITILIENDLRVVARLKLDGVHLTNGHKFVQEAKSFLCRDQVIGAFCGLSKHSGLTAAEYGANYISFQADFNRAETNKATTDLFEWWSNFIEIPLMGSAQVTI